MNSSAVHGNVFDEVPDLYDEVRPGYPEQVFEDIISLSGIPSGKRILEIGCGTGQATVPFAQRGYQMLCLELGKDLAARARENLRDYPNVEIRRTSFEDWEPEVESFDLVISATAFHWIPPEMGCAKAARVLKKSGFIALFWNYHPRPYTGFFRAVQSAYQRALPDWQDPDKGPSDEDKIRARKEQIDATGLFGPVTVRQYRWSKCYSSDQYLKLLETYSDYRSLPDDRKRVLYDGVREVMNQFGGTVTRPYLTVLFHAPRADIAQGEHTCDE